MSGRVDDCLVVGGGLVGASLAYGMHRHGATVTLLDEGDIAIRASRGNFGLILVQSKGHGLPVYADWTRQSRLLWPEFAETLLQETGVDVQLRTTGGYWFGFSDEEVEQRKTMLQPLADAAGVPFEILSPSELRERLPRLGPQVVGGSFCPLDAHVNPLRLLKALHTGLVTGGVNVVNGVTVDAMTWKDGVFSISAGAKVFRARRLVLGAGLGNRRLAPMVGLYAPVVPNRGQILVTERLQPFLPCMTNKMRQTEEGSVQLGSSEEDVGFNDLTTLPVMQAIATKAVRTFPFLKDVNLVRSWAALRVMTPDGFPIYEESETCPGAFVVTCHSGVTLAAIHSMRVSAWVLGKGPHPNEAGAFASGRFRGGEQ